MSRIKSKLSNQSGASAVLALLFFLTCTMVGSVVLTATSANVGRFAATRQTQQDYFTVSSAARLLQEELEGMSLTGGTVSDGNLAPMLRHCVDGIMRNSAPTATVSGTMTIEAAGMDTVTADYTMDADYELTITLSVLRDGVPHSPITLSLFARRLTGQESLVWTGTFFSKEVAS